MIMTPGPKSRAGGIVLSGTSKKKRKRDNSHQKDSSHQRLDEPFITASNKMSWHWDINHALSQYAHLSNAM